MTLFRHLARLLISNGLEIVLTKPKLQDRGVEGREYHKSFENVENDGQKCGDIVDFAYSCFKLPDDLKFFVRFFSKQAFYDAVKLNVLNNFGVYVSFKKYSLVLLVIAGSIDDWNETRVIVEGITIDEGVEFEIRVHDEAVLHADSALGNIIGMAGRLVSFVLHVDFHPIAQETLPVQKAHLDVGEIDEHIDGGLERHLKTPYYSNCLSICLFNYILV